MTTLIPMYHAIVSEELKPKSEPPAILGFACYDLESKTWTYERQNGNLDAVDRNLTVSEIVYVARTMQHLQGE